MAGGLAYSALIALVPGALLVASAIGLFITDPATQEQIIDFIASAVPPLEPIVRTALESVAAGAVPTTILALLGLLWGSSRFYAALDYAFSKVFPGRQQRNEVVRTLRGLLVTFLFVGLPIAALIVGSLASWVVDLAPESALVQGAGRTLVQLASPILSFLLFVGVVSAVYRFVPSEPVPARAFLRPAILVGVVLAGFTQLFTFIAPRMMGFAALFGTFVAVVRAARVDVDQLQRVAARGLVDASPGRRAGPARCAACARRAGDRPRLALAAAAAAAEARVRRQRQAAAHARLRGGRGCSGGLLDGHLRGAREHLPRRRRPDPGRVVQREQRPAGERARDASVRRRGRPGGRGRPLRRTRLPPARP